MEYKVIDNMSIIYSTEQLNYTEHGKEVETGLFIHLINNLEPKNFTETFMKYIENKLMEVIK